MVEVLEAAGDGGGGGVEGFGFVVGLAADTLAQRMRASVCAPATIPSALPKRSLNRRTNSPIRPLARPSELAVGVVPVAVPVALGRRMTVESRRAKPPKP